MNKRLAPCMLIMMILAGCQTTPASSLPEPAPTVNQPASQPEAASPPNAVPSPQTVAPIWVYDAPGEIQALRATGTGLSLIVGQSDSDVWINLSDAGTVTTPPLRLNGLMRPQHSHWMGDATPDGSRILVFSGDGRAKVINRNGATLWEGSLPQSKVGSSLYLLPNGETLISTVVTEGATGVEMNAIDLKGNLLWQFENEEAGELLWISSNSLLFSNLENTWRMGIDGKSRESLPDVQVNPVLGETIEVSADGTTFAVGSTLFDAKGKPVCSLPSNRGSQLTSDGGRILVALGRTRYVLVDRQCREVGNFSLPEAPYATNLSDDGAFVLALFKSLDPEQMVRTVLFDHTGNKLYETNLGPIEALSDGVLYSAFDPEKEQAYVSAGRRLFALPLRVSSGQ